MRRPGLTKEKLAAFLVGLLSPFTVSLVGEMPVGEIVLLVVFGWMILYLMIEHHFPERLLENAFLRWAVIAQGLAIFGYVISDISWHSTTQDLLRGWARMAFLEVDLFTIGYLVIAEGVTGLLLLEWGVAIGGMIPSLYSRPLFGDYWKFGFGGPLCLVALLLLPRFGFLAGQAVLLGLSFLNFVMNFRSLSGTFMVVALLVLVQKLPVKVRFVVLPMFCALAVVALVIASQISSTKNRAHDARSDVSRSAMLEAAFDAVEDHPFIGNGSWFGKSDVINHFLEIRFEKAQSIHLGGIGRQVIAGDEENPYAIHSQILVSLAEGGILGGVFFIVYGIMLFWALNYFVLFRPWSPLSALFVFVMISALFNLFMSPFSGVHRVYISIAAGLLILIWQQYRGARRSRRSPSSLAPQWKLERREPALANS